MLYSYDCHINTTFLCHEDTHLSTMLLEFTGFLSCLLMDGCKMIVYCYLMQLFTAASKKRIELQEELPPPMTFIISLKKKHN